MAEEEQHLHLLHLPAGLSSLSRNRLQAARGDCDGHRVDRLIRSMGKELEGEYYYSDVWASGFDECFDFGCGGGVLKRGGKGFENRT